MPGEDLLGEYGQRVAELSAVVHEARPAVELATRGLRDVLKLEAWREFTGPGGELVEHDDFVEFVTADPPRGLGVTLGLVRGLAATDQAVAARLEQTLRALPPGALPGVEEVVWEPADEETPDEETPDEETPDKGPLGEEAPDGESFDEERPEEPVAIEAESPRQPEEPEPAAPKETPALRRLREEAPALHHQVLAGELSTHAAMVAAGFRARTISVPVSRPESAAKALRKNLSREQLVELVTLLSEDL
ncbi:hypothetical protein [Nonomuraea soli]|uniref:Uncharacterized protein n=1 Tax=Nonomuraea soli TaxID=1032476 RepID=A0A7W0HP09_9ACTN|nr:hypothetical protein [Nonomuraea soli]MBA2890378.1 hypothetical protein [Nonomuraea soli]